MVKIIAEAGSCHMAKLEYAKELIDIAVHNGCWAVKFQLFRHLPPNVELPREYWKELVAYANGRIILFASVFDSKAIKLLNEYNAPYVKFAYHRSQWWDGINQAKEFAKVIVSCNPMYAHIYPEDFIKLYCIPQYPVAFEVAFDEVFKRYGFDGFSDHTLGYRQTLKAIEAGAGIIEKHITLDHNDINCPDAKFALRPKELTEMMYEIKTRFA